MSFFLLLRMLRFKCSVHTKMFVKSTFCSQPLTWGRDLKVKEDSPVELPVSLGLFLNTILGVCLGGVCIYIEMLVWKRL